jgi:Mrp family chromosome partitioning ATPase
MRGAPVAEALTPVPGLEHLYVLTSGPPALDADELLSSARCREVISSLLVGGTLVLVDTPPVLSVGDAVTFAKTAPVDGIVLVATARASERALLLAALDGLGRVGERPIGVVLTAPDRASEAPADGSLHSRSRRHRQPSYPTSDSETGEAFVRSLGYGDAVATASGAPRGALFGRRGAGGSRWP